MKAIRAQTSLTLVLVAGFVAMTVTGTPASASSRRQRSLHVTKECSAYTGAAGSFCTITASNLPAIAVGSRVFYFQPPIPSTGLLDSSVVLDAGNGNRAIGHCTLDLVTNIALCTFSDGTGDFRGFHARVDGSGSYAEFHWDGTYNFEREPGEPHDE
jgi:hypothetical protein